MKGDITKLEVDAIMDGIPRARARMKNVRSSLALLIVLAGCKSPPEEQPPPEPRPTIQALMEKWGNADTATLQAGAPDMMKGRTVLVVTVDPFPKAYEPGMPGSCFAARADDVGIVVVARAKKEPTRLTKTSVGLHDKSWRLDAIAVPEGRLVATWNRFSAADEPQTVNTARTPQGQKLLTMDVFATFPREKFDADCSALQAGSVPAAP